MSGTVFGGGPDLLGSPRSVVMGVTSPGPSATKVLTSGAFSMALLAPPRPGEVLWDDTSVSSMAIGEGARDDASLSACSGGREFPDEDDAFGIS